MKILCMDPGKTAGWAHSSAGAMISGVWKLDHGRHESASMRLIKMIKSLDEVRATLGVDILFYEEVRAHKGVDAAHWYGAYWGQIVRWCEDHGIPYEGVPVQAIKRYITGKGNAGKQAVIDAVRAQGYEPEDDNEADAIALCLLKREEFDELELN